MAHHVSSMGKVGIQRPEMNPNDLMIGAFLGFGMWLLASAVSGFRAPLWALFLLMAGMMLLASLNL